MVDTVRCIDERSLTPEFYLKLLTGAIDRYEDNQAQDNHHAPGQVSPGQDSTDRHQQLNYSNHDNNISEPSTMTWSASRVPNSGFTSPDPVNSTANQFQGLGILDEDYTYSPELASATADNYGFPSNRRANTSNRVHSPPAANQYVATPVADPYTFPEPPRAHTLPGGSPGPPSAAQKQGTKKRFSWLHHRDVKG